MNFLLLSQSRQFSQSPTLFLPRSLSYTLSPKLSIFSISQLSFLTRSSNFIISSIFPHLLSHTTKQVGIWRMREPKHAVEKLMHPMRRCIELFLILYFLLLYMPTMHIQRSMALHNGIINCITVKRWKVNNSEQEKKKKTQHNQLAWIEKRWTKMKNPTTKLEIFSVVRCRSFTKYVLSLAWFSVIQ